MYRNLLTDLQNGILTITINRPDKLNALNQGVMDELNEVINEVQQNKEIKSAIITGSGSKAFIAGADISEFTAAGVEGMALSKKGQDIFMKIERSTKPVIAAVNGFALGGGCELAMACHFRVASENAKFGQPEVNLGIIPGYGGTQRLAQLVGKGRAMELLLTGNMIDATVALQYGLINHLTSQEDLLIKAKELLTIINSKGPIAIAKCITSVNALYTPGEDGYMIEARSFGDCFRTEDMKEGTSAFLEKRKAAFTGN
jgi:enoyl-CoA hydratase